MPRCLDVVRPLLRTPCPIEPSGLPRVEGGFGCAACGRTVVDVAGLTLEEVVELRRRARSGTERICSAYTLDRKDRVLLRAAPRSATVIAVAVSALLAACDAARTVGGTETPRPSPAPQSQSTEVRSPPPVPSSTPSAKVESPPDTTKPPALPECKTRRVPGAQRAAHGRAAPSHDDSRMLAGY